MQTKVQEMQKQMAAVSLDKQDLQQAAQLQQQLQRALQEQQHMAARLQQDWQQHEAKLSTRYFAAHICDKLSCLSSELRTEMQFVLRSWQLRLSVI